MDGPRPGAPWVNGPLIENHVATFEVPLVYDAEELLADMDRIGVDEAVVVGYPITHWLDNVYTERVAAERDRLYGVVMLDPFADDAAARLRDAMATDGVLGVRSGAICPYDAMWEAMDPGVDWLLDAIEGTAFREAARETDALVQVLAHREQFDQAVELVERHPDLTYAVDHIGHPDPSIQPAEDPGFRRFGDLAANEDVAATVSEVVHWSNEGFPYRDLHDHVRWLLDAFGRERVIWGSDFPNVSDEADYVETLTWLDHVPELSDADRAWLAERSFREHVGV